MRRSNKDGSRSSFGSGRESREGSNFRSESKGSFGFRENSGFRDSSSPREMHKATCSECGNECEVPFKPTQGKPVYCKDCFRNKRRF